MTMHLYDGDGPAMHGWLDAGLLHETCDGFRCRIAVGTAGGLVCDLVEGHRHLEPIALARLATAAVDNVQPGDPDALPVTTDDGRRVMVIDDEHTVITVRGDPSYRVHLGRPAARARPSTIFALLAIGLGGLAMFASDDRAAVAALGVFMATMSAIGLFVIVQRSTASGPDGRNDAATARLAREEEQRQALPTSVTMVG